MNDDWENYYEIVCEWNDGIKEEIDQAVTEDEAKRFVREYKNKIGEDLFKNIYYKLITW